MGSVNHGTPFRYASTYIHPLDVLESIKGNSTWTMHSKKSFFSDNLYGNFPTYQLFLPQAITHPWKYEILSFPPITQFGVLL